MVLSGQVNKQVVLALRKLGVKAAGVSGKDGGILKARCKDPALGHVGRSSPPTPPSSGRCSPGAMCP